MNAKLCPKLILEGTRLTHKTDLAFALNEHPRIVGPGKYRCHSPLISGEWRAFTGGPASRGLVDFDVQEEGLAFETYATWCRLFELQRYQPWIVDRFHLSTIVWQKRHRGRDFDFRWLEERLLPLGFRAIFCTRRPDSFAGRLQRSGNPGPEDDLGSFVSEQEDMRAAVARSILPALEIDVSDDDVAGAVDRVADWLERTGGLGYPWAEHGGTPQPKRATLPAIHD